MPAPPEDLDRLPGHLLDRLSHAADAREGGWRTPMLATLTAGGTPTLRTVVLRAVDPVRRTLTVYTNRLSDKAAQIAAAPAVELGFWDGGAQEQLRVAGVARLLVDAAALDRAWETLPEPARAIYRDATAPGTPLARPGSSGVPVADPRREVFAVIEVTWARWDWLWLGPDGHRRARLAWPADGAVTAAWVEP